MFVFNVRYITYSGYLGTNKWLGLTFNDLSDGQKPERKLLKYKARVDLEHKFIIYYIINNYGCFYPYVFIFQQFRLYLQEAFMFYTLL